MLAGVGIFFASVFGLDGLSHVLSHAGLPRAAALTGILEESMEMVGSITILAGLLVHQNVLKMQHGSLK